MKKFMLLAVIAITFGIASQVQSTVSAGTVLLHDYYSEPSRYVVAGMPNYPMVLMQDMFQKAQSNQMLSPLNSQSLLLPANIQLAEYSLEYEDTEIILSIRRLTRKNEYNPSIDSALNRLAYIIALIEGNEEEMKVRAARMPLPPTAFFLATGLAGLVVTRMMARRRGLYSNGGNRAVNGRVCVKR